jgi:hypothetical protein
VAVTKCGRQTKSILLAQSVREHQHVAQVLEDHCERADLGPLGFRGLREQRVHGGLDIGEDALMRGDHRYPAALVMRQAGADLVLFHHRREGAAKAGRVADHGLDRGVFLLPGQLPQVLHRLQATVAREETKARTVLPRLGQGEDLDRQPQPVCGNRGLQLHQFVSVQRHPVAHQGIGVDLVERDFLDQQARDFGLAQPGGIGCGRELRPCGRPGGAGRSGRQYLRQHGRWGPPSGDRPKVSRRNSSSNRERSSVEGATRVLRFAMVSLSQPASDRATRPRE